MDTWPIVAQILKKKNVYQAWDGRLIWNERDVGG